MTDDRSIERAARSWLEDGPTEAPDHAVEAALLTIQSTNQERDWLPWRTRPMTQTTRLLAGSAAIAVVLIGGVILFRPGANTGVGGPSPSVPAGPSASTSGSADAVPDLTQTFTSASYGYSVHYPTGWTAKGATKSWAAIGTNTWGSGINDELTGRTARFSGSSMGLAAGQTADQWITAYANGNNTSSWPTVTIGGQGGRIDYDGGPANGGTITPGGVMFDAVVVTGGRAWNFNMDGKVDRATFEAFLASVVLDPASALPIACSLISNEEADSAAEFPGVGGVVKVVAAAGDGTTCTFLGAGINPIMDITYTKPGGQVAFQAAKRASGVQVVSGIGTDAIWDPSNGTLSLAKGDVLVTIATKNPSPSPKAAIVAIGKLIAGRM